MSYAIRFNAETNILTFSDSLIKELQKQYGYINFVFGYDGFTIYTERKFTPNSDYRMPSWGLVNQFVAPLIQEISTCLELPCDWKCKYSKGELKLIDKYKGSPEYTIYFEKLSEGVFKTLTSKYKTEYSQYFDNVRKRNNKYNLVFKESKNPIKKGYARQFGNLYYRLNENLFHLTSARYSDKSDFPVTRNMFLGCLNYSIKYKSFIFLDKQTVLKHNTVLHRELSRNFKSSYKYLFQDLEVKDKEIFVNYTPYQKVIYMVYEKGYSISSDELKKENRQQIKLTKYIQDIYPEYSSERVKEEYDKVAFVLCPPDPEIKEVKGDDILHWYDETNYCRDLGSGDLLSSCMRSSQYRERLEFYALNKNVSLIIMTIGVKLIGRALLWNCIDGSKVVDRPYLIREVDFMCLQKYIKDKNYLFVYDFRKRFDSRTKGYAPGNFSEEYLRNFEVSLNYITERLENNEECVEKRVEYSDNNHNIPYLDNFNFFDTHNMKLMTYRDKNDYCKNHEMYGVSTTYGNLYLKKTLITTFDGKTEIKSDCVNSKYHNGFIFIDDVAQVNGDYIHKDLCVKDYKGKWYLKTEAPKNILEKHPFKLGDKVKVIANTNSSCNHIGDIGTITRIEHSTCQVQVEGRGRNGNNTYYEEIEMYVEEPVEEVKVDLTEDFISAIDELFENVAIMQQEEVLTRSLNQEELEYVDEIRIA